jgi:TonB family protein
MGKTALIAFALLSATSLGTVSNIDAQSTSERKVTERIAPIYPALARRTHARGVVKLEVLVRANGSIKSTKVLGGNPVLAEAAADAVNKWKFETTQGETTEVVVLSFEPQ